MPSISISICSRVTLSGGGKWLSTAACAFISPTGTCDLAARRAAGDAGQVVQQLVELEHLRPAQLVALADRLRPLQRDDVGACDVADPDRLVAVAAVADDGHDRQPQQALERLQGTAALAEHEARLEHRPVQPALHHRLLARHFVRQ